MRASLLVAAVAVFVGLEPIEPGIERPTPPASTATAADAEDVDAGTFVAAARGTHPALCNLAAAPIGNGWGAPGAPLPEGDAAAALTEWALKPSLSDRDLIVLTEALGDDDRCVRTMAARLLADDARGVDILARSLGSADAWTRRLAAEGLGYAEASGSVSLLGRRLRDDDAGVRAAAAWALGRIEDPAAVTLLLPALEDDDPAVRVAAARALGELH